jgi:hypothetical protein
VVNSKFFSIFDRLKDIARFRFGWVSPMPGQILAVLGA